MNIDLLLKKYPRTPHLEGSRLQQGDEDLSQIRFSEIENRYLVVEEKCDGANSAISFSKDENSFICTKRRSFSVRCRSPISYSHSRFVQMV